MTTVADLRSRFVADIRNRDQWASRRSRGLGASDAASFAKLESAPSYLRAKLHNPFNGNAYTAHGNDRERHILAAFGMPQNHYMFRAAENPRHLATPDALRLDDGVLTLGQAKTVLRKYDLQEDGTVKPIPIYVDRKGNRAIPPGYRRQMWWEQYVMGADRTLFMWEGHDNRVHDLEPESCWFYRDDGEIRKLITIADIILDGMDAAEAFRKELE